MSRERWMALSFAVGSICFAIGPLGVYARLVGPQADLATYFAGSIPFTIGGAIQSWMALTDRQRARAGNRLAASALIQSVGTVFFNRTTLRALYMAPGAQHYDRLVWRPDALGSLCFLLSGLIAYAASPRRGILPARDGDGWWEPGTNLLGCILFGVSAAVGFSVAGDIAAPVISNWGTSLGAVCFLVCALATLRHGLTFKSPRLRRWEHDVDVELEHVLKLG